MSHDPALPSPEQTEALIRARRTVKPPLFAPTAIPRGVVERLLDAAAWAPTHGMNEPWRFRVYSGAGLRRLEAILTDLYVAVTPPQQHDPVKAAKLRENAAACSHAVAVFTNRDKPGKVPLLEDIEATACAVQNLMLAARAFGIGTFWSTNTVDYGDPQRIAFPGAGPGDRYLGVVFLGYPKGAFPQGNRAPVQTKLTWVESAED